MDGGAARLKEAGFNEPQAEALTTLFRDLRESDLSYLATKDDIQLLQNDIGLLKVEIAGVEVTVVVCDQKTVSI